MNGKQTRDAALELLVSTGFPNGLPATQEAGPPDLRELWFQQRTLIASSIVLCLGLGRILYRLMVMQGPFDIYLQFEALRWESVLVFIAGYGLFGDRVWKPAREGWFGQSLRRQLGTLAALPVIVELVLLASGVPVDWFLVGSCLFLFVAMTPWSDR